MKDPITTEGAGSAQNPLPSVPTTKILAIKRRSRIRLRRETMGRASTARSTLCARRERDDFAGNHRREFWGQTLNS